MVDEESLGKRRLKHSSSTGFENESAPNIRDLSIRLPAHVAQWIGRAAHRKNKTMEQFLQNLITETVEKQTEPLEIRLQRVRGLINEIAVSTRKIPMREEKDAKTRTLAHQERKKKRDHLIELGMEAYDELRMISRSEEAAKEAEFRLQAFMAMA